MFSPPGWIRREISDGIPHPFPIFSPVFHICPYSKDIQILFSLTFSLPFCNLPFIFPESCFFLYNLTCILHFFTLYPVFAEFY